MCQFDMPNVTRIPQPNRSDFCDCPRCGHCGGLKNRPLFPSYPNYPNHYPPIRHEYIPPSPYNGQPWWEANRTTCISTDRTD